MLGRDYTTLDEMAAACGVSKGGIKKRKEVKSFTFHWGKCPTGKEKRFLLADLPEKYKAKVSIYRTRAVMDERSKQPEFAPCEIVQLEDIPGVKTQEMLAEEAAEKRLLIEQGMKKFAKIPRDNRRRKRANARKWILETLWNFKRDNKCTKKAARECVASAIHGGDIVLPDSVREMMPVYRGRKGVSPATLELWDSNYANKGIMALTDGYGNRDGQNKIALCHPLYRLVIGAIIKAPQITGKAMIAFLNAKNGELKAAGKDTFPMPSQSCYERFKIKWIEEHHQAYLKLINPDRYKNVCMAAIGSHSEGIERLNQLWELDSTPADWMLADGRHSVVGVIDIFSRRLKFYVSKTSKSMAVCQLTRRAILDWGVPESARTDNGQDYVSDQYDLVLSELEIEHQLCIPFVSEEKGTIERAMRTLSHGLLNLLPGFIGHNVAERKEIEARKSFAKRIMTPDETIEIGMSAADLQQHLDNWCEHIYGKDKHSGIGMSPFVKAQSYTAPVRRISDERALDMLLCEKAGVRKIGKKGIRFNNHIYFNEEIGQYIGKDVLIKYDEADIGRLYAYVEEQFIGVMICAEVLGISSREAAAATKHKQAKKVAEQTAELRKYKHAIKKNIGETVMEYRIAESESLIAFPQKSIHHTTKGLDEAARAVAADTAGPAIIPLNDDEQAVYDALNADEPVDNTPESLRRLGHDPVRDYRLWESLKARSERGEALLSAEADFVRGYATTTEHDAMKKFIAAE